MTFTLKTIPLNKFIHFSLGIGKTLVSNVPFSLLLWFFSIILKFYSSFCCFTRNMEFALTLLLIYPHFFFAKGTHKSSFNVILLYVHVWIFFFFCWMGVENSEWFPDCFTVGGWIFTLINSLMCFFCVLCINSIFENKTCFMLRSKELTLPSIFPQHPYNLMSRFAMEMIKHFFSV